MTKEDHSIKMCIPTEAGKPTLAAEILLKSGLLSPDAPKQEMFRVNGNNGKSSLHKAMSAVFVATNTPPKFNEDANSIDRRVKVVKEEAK